MKVLFHSLLRAGFTRERMFGSLQLAADNGLKPVTILSSDACVSNWLMVAGPIFTKAHFLLPETYPQKRHLS